SLDSICERAGYTRGAFYVHFKDREDLITATMERLTNSFLNALLGAGEATLDLETIVLGFADAIDKGLFPVGGQARPHQFMAACAGAEPLRQRYVEVIEEAVARVAKSVRAAQKAGTARSDLDAERIARILTVLVLGVECVADIRLPLDVKPLARTVMKLLRAS